MHLFHGLLGLAFFCGVSWLLSSRRDRFPWRVVLVGIGMQLALGFLLLETTSGVTFFEGLGGFVTKLIDMAKPGAAMVFGPLADGEFLASQWGRDHSFIFAFAGTGLVAIIFFSALMSVLYHLGVMQVLVWCMAKVMSKLMGVSGAESMSMAANVFVGQTEAPLVVKPYIPGMTNSELNAMMTGGFATIAGSVLAIYLGMLGPEYGPHLLTASVLSAPAAFVIAKIMLPETELSATTGKVELRIERTSHNLIEAAANGTSDGLKLWLNVIAMLIAFVALVNLVNWPLGAIGNLLGMEHALDLNWIFGRLFSPIAWIMGVDGWHDCQSFGTLLGTKIAVNEFVAFDSLAHFKPGGDGGAAVFEHARSATMATYALCGFANFASVGIQLGGITPLAPERKTDLARLALRAMIGGAFASWMTATIAGMFV
ncbi:MAG: NupC/NupG family nucleoside CNT transporter [Planctomycetes bacterium]|nr:NupC/NupG family nucleoside CNT transporter [Planctomycetota bacterium]